MTRSIDAAISLTEAVPFRRMPIRSAWPAVSFERRDHLVETAQGAIERSKPRVAPSETSSVRRAIVFAAVVTCSV